MNFTIKIRSYVVISKFSMALKIQIALLFIFADIGKFRSTFSMKSKVFTHCMWWVDDVCNVIPGDHACNGFP